MANANEQGRAPNGLLMSILGRSLVTVLFTLLGLVVGLLFGALGGAAGVSAAMSGRATMGMQTPGVGGLVKLVFDLAIGGAVGALIGLALGFVVAILYPRQSA